MRTLVQRVSGARVFVDGSIVGEIDDGLLLLVGFAIGDGPADVAKTVDKVGRLRLFTDDVGKMNRSVIDIGGSVLVVSQFTLLADVRRGRRPSFSGAAPPEDAEPLIREVCSAFTLAGVGVATGVFGANMQVELTNDGPVSIVLDVVDGRVL